MIDFINKVISIGIAFVMLVMAPLVISYSNEYSMAQHLILNDVSSFIDKVTDKAAISEYDINQLYLDCNSHGITVDVQIKRIIATYVPKPGSERVVEDDAKADGSVFKDREVFYYAVTEPEEMEKMTGGDTVQVSISEVGTSPARQFIYSVLKIDSGNLRFSLAGMVG